MFLIAYTFQSCDGRPARVLQSGEENIEAFIDRLQTFKDGAYIVINVLPISDNAAHRWRGSLHGM